MKLTNQLLTALAISQLFFKAGQIEDMVGFNTTYMVELEAGVRFRFNKIWASIKLVQDVYFLYICTYNLYGHKIDIKA